MENEPVFKKEEVEEDYDVIIRTPEEVFNNYQRDFNLPIEELQTKSILDVGANEGKFIRYIRENIGNDKAFALEYQEIRTPKDRPQWWVVANGLDIPFADESFEIVTAHAYIPMFYQKGTRAIEELVRVGKRGGKLYVHGSTPEQIEQDLKIEERDEYESKESKAKTLELTRKMLEGAKEYQIYYNNLRDHGFEVTQNDYVCIIKKPS